MKSLPNLTLTCVKEADVTREHVIQSLKGHFPSGLLQLFQNEPKCKTFPIKICLICILWVKLIFTWKVSHLDSFWNRGKGNSEMAHSLLWHNLSFMDDFIQWASQSLSGLWILLSLRSAEPWFSNFSYGRFFNAQGLRSSRGTEIFALAPGPYPRHPLWMGCAAWTQKSLLHPRPTFSCILLPYSRLDTKHP